MVPNVNLDIDCQDIIKLLQRIRVLDHLGVNLNIKNLQYFKPFCALVGNFLQEWQEILKIYVLVLLLLDSS